MIQLDLDSDERAILAEVLDTALSDLRMEISDTDSMDFRQQLKRRKEVIEKALAAIRSQA